MNRLENKIAIITGAASEIGRATASLFVSEGARVLVSDLSEGVCKAAVRQIGRENVSYLACNVAEPEDNVKLAQRAVELFGGVDILIANAGIEGDTRDILSLTEEAFDLPYKVNVKGPFHGIRAVAKYMKKRGGGSVVIKSSIAAQRAGPLPYTTSQHAVTGLTRSAARQLARYKIRVNSVNPGAVSTNMMYESRLQTGGAKVAGAMKAQIPLHRFATPAEIAEVILFLSSDASACITGSAYVIDGGELS
ncbi:glucose 1-dehydrogenase [Ruegeria sp. HKCCE3926]|uniref:SDR family NAD(P)-dependent oxidoreductase n=1 Tax=Ruegeria sp. HKCCE3926 TaxID=2794831 RepID=UPI001AE9F951|nr:glucose 1-dehydrogenase [Ruegeria sp. HKCCE3926]